MTDLPSLKSALPQRNLAPAPCVFNIPEAGI
jgi:hypothetical protein